MAEIKDGRSFALFLHHSKCLVVMICISHSLSFPFNTPELEDGGARKNNSFLYGIVHLLNVSLFCPGVPKSVPAPPSLLLALSWTCPGARPHLVGMGITDHPSCAPVGWQAWECRARPPPLWSLASSLSPSCNLTPGSQQPGPLPALLGG